MGPSSSEASDEHERAEMDSAGDGHRNDHLQGVTQRTAPGSVSPPLMPEPDRQRGDTHIAERVVEKIASQAVSEVDHAGGISRRVLGMKLGADTPGQAARTTAKVDGGIVTVTARLSVLYPSPVRQTAAAVREHVTTTVHRLTDLDVRYVDIEVTRLLPPATGSRRPR